MLKTPVSALPRTTPRTVNRLQALGIFTYQDLIGHVPFRYNNASVISEIGSLQEGEFVTIKGTVTDSETKYTRSRKTVQKVTIADKSGSVSCSWFNQPYITGILKPGTAIALVGSVKRFLGTTSFDPMDYEVIRYPGQPLIHAGRLVPVYPETRGISSKTIREKIWYVLGLIANDQEAQTTLDWLPKRITETYALTEAWRAYRSIHFPETETAEKQARNRLGFEEIFRLQLAGALVRMEWQKETVTNPFTKARRTDPSIQEFIDHLPFKLTHAQNRVIEEIFEDLFRTIPMNRFVQGDVGSGKTVVAAVAAYAAYLNSFQTIIMAPTEILASQHYETIAKLFAHTKVKTALQTGSHKMLNRDENFDIIVGTQAVITKSVQLDRVGLVVVDEQHRFGVVQRAQLKEKGYNPHLLTMTATPIPRTVALTLHGELDISEIDEMPKGRKPIKTYVVPSGKRTSAYEWIRKEIKKTGCQVFVICPLIEESEKETMKSMKAAGAEYERLQKTIFPDLKVALLHGKMKSKEKDEVMNEFANKQADILVSTSVVEVGIDIPNATIMLIEGAERFGLAQLHQLRGRVGRGNVQSHCLLFTSKADTSAKHRLAFFAAQKNGMKLAEYDLKLRGPGTLFGTRQSGFADLKIADYSNTKEVSRVSSAVRDALTHATPKEMARLKEKVEEYQTKLIARD